MGNFGNMIAIANLVTKEKKQIDENCTNQFKQIMSEFYTSPAFINFYKKGISEMSTKINYPTTCPDEITIRHNDLIATVVKKPDGPIAIIQVIKRPIIAQILLDFF